MGIPWVILIGKSHIRNGPDFEGTVDRMSYSPLEYEQYCLSQMRLEGWRGESTPTTSDQGADVICDYGDIRAVIQCKLYGQPVGNKAVQEVIAARIYYEANVAAVVTNSSFTKSAMLLAEKSMVTLLHDTELRDWAKRNKPKSTADHSQVVSINEIINALNLHGYRVTKRSRGRFEVSTPNGKRYANGESALMALATHLLNI